MLKVLRNLKESWVLVLIIIILLCVQASADLKLPDFTSKIVNVGIQQGGIENTSPEIIRKSTLDKIMYFTDKDNEILAKYNALESNDENISKYPILKDESLYELTSVTSAERKQLDEYFQKPLMILNFIESEEYSEQVKAQFQNSINNPSAQNSLLQQIDSQISAMPDTIKEQAAYSYLKKEYEEIGVDTTKISNTYILKTGVQMLGVAFISMVSAILIMLFSSKVATKLGKTLREKVFKKTLSFSNKEFTEFSSASLITRNTNDIQRIQELLGMMFRVLVYAPIMAIGGFVAVITSSNFSMAWIIGLAVFLIILLVIILFATTMPRFKLMQKLIDRLNLVSREILKGIPVIRAFNTQKREENRFDEANNNLMRNSIFVNRVMCLMDPLMMLIMQSVLILIIWVGGHRIDEGVMQVGNMMAFLQYTMHIVMSFLFISMLSIMLPRASVSANRINEVLEKKPSIEDKPKNKQAKFDNSKKGLVEFKNVSFRYPDADSEILTDINFTAKPGETTAIIGSTGSGKSTVINLIPRFYDVTGGEILVDGANIKDVPQQELRKKIGYVPQRGMLFTGTIESNIKYGKNISNEEMEKVADIAQAKEFIDSKEDGYKSEIAQGGDNVSGGQRQRLSIARALAIDPEIFIFDDSFSALDLKTDRNLREALKTKTVGKTVIIVAQRVSTIINAEQIIVLEEGKIVGKGTHSELLKNCETYKQIATSQLSEKELGLEEVK